MESVTKYETFVYCSVQVCNQVFAAGCNKNVNSNVEGLLLLVTGCYYFCLLLVNVDCCYSKTANLFLLVFRYNLSIASNAAL